MSCRGPFDRVQLGGGLSHPTVAPWAEPWRNFGDQVAYGLRRIPGLKNNPLLDQIMPFELDFLRYPWVVDTTKMREELGYEPKHTAEEAVETFRNTLRLKRYTEVLPGRSKTDGIRAFLKGRREEKEQL